MKKLSLRKLNNGMEILTVGGCKYIKHEGVFGWVVHKDDGLTREDLRVEINKRQGLTPVIKECPKEQLMFDLLLTVPSNTLELMSNQMNVSNVNYLRYSKEHQAFISNTQEGITKEMLEEEINRRIK